MDNGIDKETERFELWKSISESRFPDSTDSMLRELLF